MVSLDELISGGREEFIYYKQTRTNWSIGFYVKICNKNTFNFDLLRLD